MASIETAYLLASIWLKTNKCEKHNNQSSNYFSSLRILFRVEILKTVAFKKSTLIQNIQYVYILKIAFYILFLYLSILHTEDSLPY